MPNNFDKLFNQAQGNELINALKGIKSSLDVNYPLETVNVTLSNNAQNITPSENYYGLGQVNVPGMNLSDMTILVNGNYDPVTSGLDGYGKLNVNVPTWGQADEGKVVSNNALVPQTNREVNANGTYDTTLNNSVLVNVPNTYGSEDEGKVVMNNALVPQTNRSITQNGTYDTTTNDEVVVNVEGGGGGGEASPKVIDDAIELVVARNDGVFDENEGVHVASGRTIEYDLGAANTDFTVYLVGKSVPTSGTARLLMSPYSSGTGNYCGFFRKNTHLWTSTYNNDDDLNIDANSVYIIAMSMDNTTKKIKFFANDSKVNEEDFLNSASKIVLGGDSGYYETLYCYYFAIVPSVQSESEIISNLGKINDNYINGHGGGGGSGDSVYFKFGNSSTVIKADTSADVGPLSNYSTDYIVPCDSEGTDVKLDLSQPFEICCKFKLTTSPGSTPRNIWGSVNSYYHCPSMNITNSKIGYNVSTNGSSWAYDGTAITPSGWSCPLNTFITVKMTWDGTDFTFFVNDGTSEYTATLQNTTPYYNANYAFAFGGQNKSQYSIAAIGAVIDLNNTYLKQNNTKIWYSSVAMLIEKTITENGTYNAEDDNADGYSEVVVNVSGEDLYPLWTEIYNGLPSGYSTLGTPMISGPRTMPSWVNTASQDAQNFISQCRLSSKGSSSTGRNISAEITNDVAQHTLQELIQMGTFNGIIEYYGYVYNTSLITDYNMVLLGDFSQGGTDSGNVLSDSIMNYSAIILQGIYNKQRESGYNTTIVWMPELNRAFWTGMKDRNYSYYCEVTFTDNTHASLTGNKQVIIYGIV